jgi:hypothetical protein
MEDDTNYPGGLPNMILYWVPKLSEIEAVDVIDGKACNFKFTLPTGHTMVQNFPELIPVENGKYTVRALVGIAAMKNAQDDGAM